MITYTQDVPRGAVIAQATVTDHVIEHLSAVASADDDPATNADNVRIEVLPHPDDPSMVRIVGTLDAEPSAPYLDHGFDPLAGVDPALFTEQVEAAESDVEVLRDGQA